MLLLSGHIHEFHNFLQFLPRCAREHGDIVGIRFGPLRLFLVNHPDLIEQVLVTDARPRTARSHEGEGITVHDAVLRARRNRRSEGV